MSQEPPLGWALFFALLAGLANVFGGLMATLWAHWNRTFLKLLIGFSAGFMLALGLLEVSPHAIDYGLEPHEVGLWILVGYLAMFLFEHTLPGHFHYSEQRHREAEAPHLWLHASSAYPVLLGIALHSFFDGVAIGAGFRLSFPLGFLLFLAVAFHTVPVGATVSTLMLVTEQGFKRALGAAIFVGLATVLGALAVDLPALWVGYALSFATGVLLHVAASDLIPEVYEEPSRAPDVAVIVGALVFGLANYAFHLLGWHP